MMNCFESLTHCDYKLNFTSCKFIKIGCDTQNVYTRNKATYCICFVSHTCTYMHTPKQVGELLYYGAVSLTHVLHVHYIWGKLNSYCG